MAESPTSQQEVVAPQEPQELQAGASSPWISSLDIAEDEEHAALLPGNDDADDDNDPSTMVLERMTQTRKSRTVVLFLSVFLVLAALLGFLASGHYHRRVKGHNKQNVKRNPINYNGTRLPGNNKPANMHLDPLPKLPELLNNGTGLPGNNKPANMHLDPLPKLPELPNNGTGLPGNKEPANARLDPLLPKLPELPNNETGIPGNNEPANARLDPLLHKLPELPPQQTKPQPDNGDPDKQDEETKIKYYSGAKTDRAGSQILDMLMMDAFIYHEGGVYGGACAHFDGEKGKKTFEKHLPDKQRLIRALGMEEVFKFACPTKQELATGKAKMLGRNEYHTFSRDFSMEWVNHVRAQGTFQYTTRPADAPVQIAVHMRRGDYHPCRHGHGQKYLPNAYYINVLDEYLPQYCPDVKACNLTIYTERQSFEDFTPFEERNYHLDFDSSLEQIWAAFMNADLLILSKSSFSWVPAIMNQHHVVTPQYKYPVADNWEVASDEICNESDKLVNDFLDSNHCQRWLRKNFLKKNPGHREISVGTVN